MAVNSILAGPTDNNGPTIGEGLHLIIETNVDRAKCLPWIRSSNSNVCVITIIIVHKS